jgi:hypothetical protein
VGSNSSKKATSLFSQGAKVKRYHPMILADLETPFRLTVVAEQANRKISNKVLRQRLKLPLAATLPPFES